MSGFSKSGLLAGMLGVLALGALPAYAQQAAPDPSAAADSDEPVTDPSTRNERDIAKESENPVGNLTIMPLQNYTNFGFGPHDGTQNILEFEPVVPFHITPDWNLIARAILPVVWNPDLSPAHSVPQAFAPTDFSAFFSPSHPVNGITWGVGPIVQSPTATSPTVGSSVWGAGPTAVIVYSKGPWVGGGLVDQVWSFGGVNSGPGGKRYAEALIQPFINYNFDKGWFVGSAPIITDEESLSGRKWTVPVGAIGGRLFRVGKLPIKVIAGAYYNVVTPQYGAKWQIISSVFVIF